MASFGVILSAYKLEFESSKLLYHRQASLIKGLRLHLNKDADFHYL